MSRLETSIRRTVKRSWNFFATCTATARQSAWSHTTSATPTLRNARFICSTAVSSKKHVKPASAHKEDEPLESQHGNPHLCLHTWPLSSHTFPPGARFSWI